jgi:ketosteroid isomerase-like protein
MTGAARTPFGPDTRLPARRTLEDRVIVRWPRLYAALSRVGSRLPPQSRIRRAVLRRATLSAWGAWARGDIDLTLVRLAPDFHIELQPEWVAAGMRSSYEGYAGVRERAADQHEVWQRMEFIPQELVDAGDVIVVLGSYHVRARGSGIEFNSPIGSVFWLERGLIVREHDFGSWEEALRVAGVTASTESAPSAVTSQP